MTYCPHLASHEHYRTAKTVEAKLPAHVQKLFTKIHDTGGKAYVVGGFVRDALLGIDASDLDVEVFGLKAEELVECLEALGQVHSVGESFGIHILNVPEVERFSTIDVAMPRRERTTGHGHRAFDVSVDPILPFKIAAERRDFTINALSLDPLSGVVYDAVGGLEDLQQKSLRHVSSAFVEDPLRVLRAAQFAGRLGFQVADETLDLCRSIRPELNHLARERIWQEWTKILIKARHPSVALEVLRLSDALSLFPELESLVGVPQEREWHPEGDVWVHTLMVLDVAADIIHREKLNEEDALVLALGALCHDLGKPGTTSFNRGRIRSIHHEVGGVEPTEQFLTRIGAPKALIPRVTPLVREHLKPFQLYAERDKIGDAAIRRLATRASIPELVRVAVCDFRGRTTHDALLGKDFVSPWLLGQSKRLAVTDSAPKPLVQGRDLLSLGLKPGPHLGVHLKSLYEAQLDGVFNSRESGIDYFRETLLDSGRDF